MKVKYSIKIVPDTYEQMFTLPCVTSVIRNGNKKKKNDITVSLSPEQTNGRLLAHTGDWLVQYTNGKWQVFGAKAYETLIHNPKEGIWNE